MSRNRQRKNTQYPNPYRSKQFQEFEEFQQYKESKKQQPKVKTFKKFEDIDFGDDWVASRDRELEEKTPKFQPRTENQRVYVDAVHDNDLIFVFGPPGSGKSATSVGMALEYLRNGEVDKIIITRPAVEVGRPLGFLPGGIDEKLNPYLQPLFDEFIKFTTPDEWKKLKKSEQLEIIGLNFARGRTFSDAFFILDESQNCTKDELKMILTRMGHGSKYIINGDTEQSDLPYSQQGWFKTYANRYSEIDGVALVQLNRMDIQRHPLVGQMLQMGFD